MIEPNQGIIIHQEGLYEDDGVETYYRTLLQALE